MGGPRGNPTVSINHDLGDTEFWRSLATVSDVTSFRSKPFSSRAGLQEGTRWQSTTPSNYLLLLHTPTYYYILLKKYRFSPKIYLGSTSALPRLYLGSTSAPGSPSGEIIAIQNLGCRRKCDGFPGTGFHWRELKSYLPRYENLRSAATCRVPIGFFFFQILLRTDEIWGVPAEIQQYL